ncbi:hypothetical protein ACFLZ9_01225 [Patescibacteria group bacterium]
MNQCETFQIPCPWAISLDNASLPCFVPSQKDCDNWKEKVKRESRERSEDRSSNLSQ